MKQYSGWLTLAPLALTLASCDWLGIDNPLRDDKRPTQVVEGARRTPALNPKSPAVVPQKQATVLPSATGASATTDPYDYYNASGDEITPEEPADRSATVRKPLSANPYYAHESADVSPLASISASDRSGLASVPPDAIKPWTPPDATPKPEETPEPAAAIHPLLAPEPAEPASETVDELMEPVMPPRYHSGAPKDNREPPENSANVLPTNVGQPSGEAVTPPLEQAKAESLDSAGHESWFERWFGKHSGNEQDPARDMPTPPLSSLPPTPEKFKTIKNEKIQNMQDLQGARIEADQEKQELDSEPSNPQPAPVDATPTGNNQPAGDQPVLLGHVTAPVTAPTSMPSDAASLPPPIDEPDEEPATNNDATGKAAPNATLPPHAAR